MDIKLEEARQHFLEGIEHFESDRMAEARTCFEASLALAPGRASVLGNLGITLFRLGLWHEAVPVLRKATLADPLNGEAWISLGLCHEACAQWGESADALERGLTLVPAQPRLWLAYGQCLAKLGNEREALKAFERALDIDGNCGDAWTLRGGLLREMHRLDEAAQCFEQAIERGGDRALNAYYLAAVRGSGGPAAPPREYVEGLFDEYSADFQSHLVDHLKYRGFEWLLRPLIESGTRYRSVLDLGCGTGLCGPVIAPLSDAVVGIDISAAMLEQAHGLGVYSDLIHEDVGTFLATTERHADLVIAADVFIYVGALDEVFRGVRRILEPGGCFAFTAELPPPDEDGFRLLPSLRYGHSESYVRRMAADHGFRVRDLVTAPLREHELEPIQALYVYLE